MKFYPKKGRPYGTMMDPSNLYVPISTRIPQYIRDRMDTIALKTNKKRSEVVLEAINDYLWRYQNLWSEKV